MHARPERMPSAIWLDDLGALLGPAGLLRPDQGLTPAEREPYELDWRRRYRGQALAIARPADAGQVQAVVRACIRRLGAGAPPSDAHTALKQALITPPSAMSEAVRARLGPIIARYL